MVELISSDVRPFPIQQGKPRRNNEGALIIPHCSFIPWWLAAEAYKSYVAQFGDSQSLERLAERGGFGRNELLQLLRFSNEPS